jgi:DNA-binding transcriptional regulator YhcF (GntR family)
MYARSTRCAFCSDGMATLSVRSGSPDRSPATDLYERVAAEIRRAIADGEARPGERLPPAKDLAAVLGVEFARRQGYRVDELLAIIEEVA